MMNPRWSGARDSLGEAAGEAVKLRTAPEDWSPKPDLNGELKHSDGLSGRQYSTPPSQSASEAGGYNVSINLPGDLNIS